MLLDGWHLLGEAAAARVAVEKIAICGPPTATEQTVVDRLRRSGAQIVEVSGTVLNALSPVNSPTGVVASARQPVGDVSARCLDAGAGAGAGRGRAAGSRQRRRDHSIGRRRRRHRRRARRIVGRSVGLEGAARVDGQRVSSAGACAAARSTTLIDEWRARRRAHRRHRAARRHADARRRLHAADGGAARRRRRRPAGRSGRRPPMRASAFRCAAASNR